MEKEKQLLERMKKTRAERVRLLSMQDTSQLIKLIERLGHFDLTDADIAWLEKKCNSKTEVKP